jgi:iron uptake system component EfeO
MTMRDFLRIGMCGVALLAGACSRPAAPATNDDFRVQVTQGMHDSLLVGIDGLVAALTELQAAAPTPTNRGWDAKADAAAIAGMRSAWRKARTSYEHIEGAIAPLFPEIDNALDARYDDYLQQQGGLGDDKPFDDAGVTGMHGIERILYSDTIPAHVVDFESKLPGYGAARFPATAAEAADFKNKLCAKAIADATTLRVQWSPQRIDVAGAFQGLIALMNEQREKVNKAAAFEEESRYSQRTMVDIRDNLDGTTAVYQLFVPWLQSQAGGAAIDQKIAAGFATLAKVYAKYPGDALPAPPATWSSLNPTPQDLATPFGQLYSAVAAAVDPAKQGSIVFEMNAGAVLLGFPQFQEPQ